MEDAAKAIWGHYIVPMQPNGAFVAPVQLPPVFTHPAALFNGAPGIPLDPTTIPDFKRRPDQYRCIEAVS